MSLPPSSLMHTQEHTKECTNQIITQTNMSSLIFGEVPDCKKTACVERTKDVALFLRRGKECENERSNTNSTYLAIDSVMSRRQQRGGSIAMHSVACCLVEITWRILTTFTGSFVRLERKHCGPGAGGRQVRPRRRSFSRCIVRCSVAAAVETVVAARRRRCRGRVGQGGCRRAYVTMGSC